MSVENTPEVLILKALNTTNTPAGDFEYKNLDGELTKQAKYEAVRWRQFSDAPSESIDEHEPAHKLAMVYLLQTTKQLVGKALDDEMYDTVASRYTHASQELYETYVDKQIWTKIFTSHVTELKENDTQPARELLTRYHKLGYRSDQAQEVDKSDIELKPDNEWQRHFLDQLNPILSLVTKDEYEPEDLVGLFGDCIAKLADIEQDDAWNEWKIELDDTSGIVKVSPSEQLVKVGAKRQTSSQLKIKKLVAHEIGTHARRGQHGSKLDQRLKDGLPGYMDAEEGLATISEMCVDGKVPGKLEKRCLSMGIAMGMLGKYPSRKDMIIVTKLRDLVETPELSSKEIHEKAKKYVNRMYRGGKGKVPRGRQQAIFTKDLVYFNGYQKMSTYINESLANGQSVEELSEYLFSGKFDPTSEIHQRYVEDIKSE